MAVGAISLEGAHVLRASELPSFPWCHAPARGPRGRSTRPSAPVRRPRRGSNGPGPRRSAHRASARYRGRDQVPSPEAFGSRRRGNGSAMRTRPSAGTGRRTRPRSGFSPASAYTARDHASAGASRRSNSLGNSLLSRARRLSRSVKYSIGRPALFRIGQIELDQLTWCQGAGWQIVLAAHGLTLSKNGDPNTHPQVSALAEQKRRTCYRMRRSAKSYALGREAIHPSPMTAERAPRRGGAPPGARLPPAARSAPSGKSQ